MLRILRQGQRWVTALFVVGVGGVFVFFIGLGQPLQSGRGDAVVRVGPHRFGIAEFEREREQREQQYREALGEQFDSRALSDDLDALAARTLIEKAILALEAESLGLTVSKGEVERIVLAADAFRDSGGRFDEQAYRDWAAYNFGSERGFLTEQRLESLASKLIRLVGGQARVSEGEAREAVRRRLQGVQIAFVALDGAAAPEGFEIPEAETEAFLATRGAEAQALYDERSDRYDVPEQVRARHILIQVDREADEAAVAEAEAEARELLGRLEAGEEFAELAAEHSDDPGSKANGGDLGFFRRGQMVGPFEEAAFSLEPGATSEPVRSDFGFHVIRVEERRAAELRTFEDVKAELAQEILGREAAGAAARERAERLAAAIREGQSLEEAARSDELTLERSGLLRRRPDGYVPGLGAAQELLAAAFTLEAGESSARIFEVGDKLALVQVLAREEPDEAVLEAELEGERSRLQARKREALVSTWIGQRRAELLDDGELSVDLAAVAR
jgi:peptidyl-prolyl cis-trans isomerase D